MIKLLAKNKGVLKMAEEKKAYKIIFDINKFTQALIATGEREKHCYNLYLLVYGYLMPNANREDVKSFQTYYAMAHDDQEYAEIMNYLGQDENAKYVHEVAYHMYKNPQSTVARTFTEYWNFINCVFRDKPTSEELNLVLKKLSTFDEKTQYEILMALFERSNLDYLKYKDVQTNLSVLLFNRPEAPFEIKAYCINRLHNMNVNSDKLEDMRIELLEAAKKEIDKELHKDFPSVPYIAKVCKLADGQIPVKLWEEYKPYFNIEKITSADANYIRKLQKTTEERLTEVDKRIAEQKQQYETVIEEKDKELKETQNSLQKNLNRAEKAEHSAQQDKDWYEKELAKERDNVEKLKKKNSELTGEMNKLEKANTEMNGKLKKLRIILGKMKVGGLFNKNTDEIKQMQDIVDTYTL